MNFKHYLIKQLVLFCYFLIELAENILIKLKKSCNHPVDKLQNYTTSRGELTQVMVCQVCGEMRKTTIEDIVNVVIHQPINMEDSKNWQNKVTKKEELLKE